ncbi:hypothetical protein M3650_20570 [Paenibacillus sp. MER TA 81-3]|uniref:hypothetical protein n=1 Tax=Paenibacillus sp. MER TA 81-3 TaxID=2939573 RepID=UPI00203F3FF0|nr:hypothetical protein [Paenibacillus sp. MER TA 81-3]MCM3340958.1 hypothetical protein [Paenibacillus sp. MER TA 81-3]
MLKRVQYWSEDFSDGKDNFGTKLTGNAEVVKDKKGEYCLKIAKEGFSEKRYGIQFLKSHKYKISMVVKADQPKTIFAMKFMDETNKNTPIELKSTNPIRLTTEYQEYSLEYTTDKELVQGSVYFQFWEGGGSVSKISLSEAVPNYQGVEPDKDIEWLELYHYFYDKELHTYSFHIKTSVYEHPQYKLFINNEEIHINKPDAVSNVSYSEKFTFTNGAELRLEASKNGENYKVVYETSYETFENYLQDDLVRIVVYPQTGKREIGFHLSPKSKEKRYNVEFRKNHICKISVDATPAFVMKLMDETNKNSPIELKSTNSNPITTENQGYSLEYISDKDIAHGSIYFQFTEVGEKGYCEVAETPLSK